MTPQAGFLADGGELGALMRAHDWAATPLGPPEGWPQPLRTLAGVLLGSSQPMFLVWGPGRTLLYNDAYAEVLGLKHPGALGRDFLDVWDEIRADLVPIVERAYGGEPVHMDDIVLLMERRGFREETHFAFSYTPIHGEDGTVAGFFCPCQEITGQVMAERQRTFLLALEDRLRPLADPEEIKAAAAELLGRELNVGRVAYMEVDEEASETRITREYLAPGMPPSVGVYRLAELGPVFEAYRTGEPLVVEEHRSDPRTAALARLPELVATGVRSVLDVPLLRDGRIAGVLVVNDARPRRWTGAEVELARAVAERTRAAVERGEAEASLRASEERFRAIVETARDYAIFTTDTEGRIVTWPAGAEAVLGWTAAEAVGQPFAMVFTPEDRAAGVPEAELRVARAEGQAPDVRWHLRRDGSRVFIDGMARPLAGADGAIAGFVKVGQDVTERRATEEALRHSEARLRFMGGLDDALRASQGAPEAMLAATELLARHLGASRCAYADVDADNDRFVIRSDYTVPGLESSIGTYSLDLFGSRAAADMRQGRTLVIRDIPAELAPADGREMFLSIGISAIVCCPLVKDGRLVAMMAVHQSGPRDWRPDEIALVEAAVERCWAHVERVGAEARLRDSEARFRAAFEQAAAGFARTDLTGRFIEVNNRFCQITGRARDELLALRMQDITHPDDLAANLPFFEDAARGGPSFEIEKRYLRPDGAPVWVRNSVSGMRESEAVTSMLAVSIDISDRWRAEAALRESEERLRLVQEAGGIGSFDYDLQKDEAICSPEYYAILGLPEGHSINRETWSAVLHPEDRHKAVEALDRAIAERIPFDFEYRIVRSDDGQVRWLTGRAAVIFDSDGQPWRYVGGNIDITALNEAQERLRELNETLESQVAQRTAERDRAWRLSQDILAAVAPDGVITALNASWTRLLGWEVTESVGRGFAELTHPDDLEETLQVFESVFETPLSTPYEFRLRHKDGTYRWFAWTAAFEDDRVYASGRDVTAEKERQAELEAAQEALRQSQKMEAMGQLTGGVAHDFNNLLTPIIGSLDRLVTRGVGSERERRLMAGALESAERAKTLVQRLLAFARRQPLQPVAVDVGALVEGMTGLIGSTLGPTIEVRVELAEDLPPAKADPNQLEMALLNLAVNARDAMPDGGRLTIAVARESVRGPNGRGGRRPGTGLKPGHYVRLAVADTGTGMDAATRERAVEPFFSTKGVGRGTGLGLSMVHGLAAQLGGGLAIDSEPGRGTTVELWLPIGAGPIGEADRDRARPLPPATSRGRALLVDDEPLVRMSTADMLADLSLDVLEASSAEDALRLLREGAAVDLLVTDHLMPGMSGAELVREARSLRPDLPALIVSGYAEAEGLPTDLPRLVKPFRAAELAERVGAIMPDAAPDA